MIVVIECDHGRSDRKFCYTMTATMIADFVKRSKFCYIRHAKKDSDCGRSAER